VCAIRVSLYLVEWPDKRQQTTTQQRKREKKVPSRTCWSKNNECWLAGGGLMTGEWRERTEDGGRATPPASHTSRTTTAGHIFLNTHSSGVVPSKTKTKKRTMDGWMDGWMDDADLYCPASTGNNAE
jgi:hypothetical protein